MGQDITVRKFDQAVNNALGVNHDVNLLRAQIEEPHRLHNLQALVHQRRRIDGDLAPHLPRRVPQRIRGRDRFQLGRRAATERSS